MELTWFCTYFGCNAFVIRQLSTGVLGSSDKAMLSSLLNISDSLAKINEFFK